MPKTCSQETRSKSLLDADTASRNLLFRHWAADVAKAIGLDEARIPPAMASNRYSRG